ncbi:uncharacterized protein L969DRAFT_88688 [Mixia osmundae IAM 14324]|uniref:uncharacterized protein n=1 Tax=Mixia osmundae (strain CBS 9802 / IAM 14324 / JCM 22182 / KY 12970) TaxID=764103 RepID=UPI0004A5560D|nr:uncharacterized protein L969DRAFT_88688 [Mixia osmundae IAM 14324]KEI38244.1 hypothetical protein L969DRAFT_88688 [Mixia osmundae IAM 14324]
MEAPKIKSASSQQAQLEQLKRLQAQRSSEVTLQEEEEDEHDIVDGTPARAQEDAEPEEEREQAAIQDTTAGLRQMLSHEAVLKDHSKTISALDIDPSGNRVVSGSYDYEIKLWDFGGMNVSLRPFRSFESAGSYQIHDLAWSHTGKSFLVANGTSQPKIYDRDGVELMTFEKGDMYIRDLRNTAGHVAEISSIAWHPTNPDIFLTASGDSTLRIWDVNKRLKSKSVIVVKSKDRGARTKVTACAWSPPPSEPAGALDDDGQPKTASAPGGKLIFAAGLDGSLHYWNASGNFARPNGSIEGAHTKDVETTSIVAHPDGRKLFTRSLEGTVKCWDLRAFKKPLKVIDGLPALNAETNMCLSPDGRYLLTGTAGSKAAVVPGKESDPLVGGAEKGRLVMIDTESLEIAHSIDVSEGSVVRVAWHPRINQIFAGTSLGTIHVFYDPQLSQRGAVLSLGRAARKRAVEDVFMPQGVGQIVAPDTLPMYKEDLNRGPGKRRKEKDRMDGVKTFRPLPPMSGPGKGGRVGSAATAHVVAGLVRDNTREEDVSHLVHARPCAHATDSRAQHYWLMTRQPRPIQSIQLVSAPRIS